ncbi:hypothetical protein [Endozoicomonas sp. SCSIO W0465]|uniref:outer membrane lipoprotein n=1 Tax=Endozoicomonas sp. SCSIO W0465 TaxID=2918516 RepID=UPI002076110A|nr:hypothetical protein [Endozoicomonas sp. SCSIO W0465]USE38366.1 hypothetical protein MJO57_09465 [Endozoicomonas sp. SCSIO W0465]
MKKLNLTTLLVFLLITLGGCSSPNPYGDNYGAGDVQTIQQVYYGTVLKVEPVTIDASTQTNTIGTIAGVAIGGILGSEIGHGGGSALGAIGGTLLGGYVGSKASEDLGQRNGVNLTIRLEDGQVISIVQAADPDMMFGPGEQVQINVSGNHANVVPRY